MDSFIDFLLVFYTDIQIKPKKSFEVVCLAFVEEENIVFIKSDLCRLRIQIQRSCKKLINVIIHKIIQIEEKILSKFFDKLSFSQTFISACWVSSIDGCLALYIELNSSTILMIAINYAYTFAKSTFSGHKYM